MTRMSFTMSERADKFATTHRESLEIIEAQKAERERKTARLKAARLARDAEQASNLRPDRRKTAKS